MIKMFCDRCGKEIDNPSRTEFGTVTIERHTEDGVKSVLPDMDLCEDCFSAIIRFCRGTTEPKKPARKQKQKPPEEPQEDADGETVTEADLDALEALLDAGKEEKAPKRFDMNKMVSLHNAGWDNRAIAEEMNVTEKYIGDQLHNARTQGMDVWNDLKIKDFQNKSRRIL